MIHARNISKNYGDITALRDVSFDIQPGEIVGLLGPNGAGKSTAIKVITGFLHPDAGSVTIDGRSVLTQLRAVQAKIGYLSEDTPLYPELSVQNYLKLIADLRGIEQSDLPRLLSAAVYGAGLADYLARPIASLSKGLRQRVGLAQAILHQPPFLILDEPTVGLDPTQIVEIRALIKSLAQRSAILFSSHILSEVESICDRVVIIINGEVKADQRLDALSQSDDATLVLQREPADLMETLSAMDFVADVRAAQSADGYPAWRVTGSGDITPALFQLATQHNWALRELRRDAVTLESFFNQVATGA